jgi:hypothetical protein
VKSDPSTVAAVAAVAAILTVTATAAAADLSAAAAAVAVGAAATAVSAGQAVWVSRHTWTAAAKDRDVAQAREAGYDHACRVHRIGR